MRHYLSLVIVAITVALPAASQTNLRGWHADGQTWLVWEDDQTFQSNESYSIHASLSSITNLGGAPEIGRILPADWKAGRLKIVDPTLTFTIPDGQGGTYTLASNEALFVGTPMSATTAWFAVVKTGGTTVGPGNTTGPIAQSVDAVRPHAQHSGIDAGHPFTVYTMWLDGRTDHTSGRPDFPVMANRSFNGTSQMFCVFEPTNPTMGPIPAVAFLHGGGGNAWRFRPSRSADTRLDLDLPDALYVTLDDNWNFWTGPGTDQVLGIVSLWFGYCETWNRFADSTLVPPNGALIPDYTHRRIAWILDWLVVEKNVDPDRTALAGLSQGARGASGFARARPSDVSAATLFVLPPTWPVPTASAIWGTEAQDLSTTLPGAVSFADYLRTSTQIVGEDVPLLRIVNGTNDAQVPWEDVPTLYDELEALRWGVHLYWDERGHVGGNGLWDGAHWTLSPDHSLTELTRFRRDVAFPAITNLDVDPDLAGRQHDPGDAVFPANGDPWGAWGGFVDWNPDTILDRPNAFGVTLRLTQPSAMQSTPVPPAVSFDVTVRRAQRWSPSPLGRHAWHWVDLSTGAILGAGFGRAGIDGTTTVPGLRLEETMTAGARLEIVAVRDRQPQ